MTKFGSSLSNLSVVVSSGVFMGVIHSTTWVYHQLQLSLLPTTLWRTHMKQPVCFLSSKNVYDRSYTWIKWTYQFANPQVNSLWLHEQRDPWPQCGLNLWKKMSRAKLQCKIGSYRGKSIKWVQCKACDHWYHLYCIGIA